MDTLIKNFLNEICCKYNVVMWYKNEKRFKIVTYTCRVVITSAQTSFLHETPYVIQPYFV